MSEGAPTEILSALEDALGRVLEPIAQACSIDGKIDSERTDNWQAALYDLAVTYAELRAARVLATKWAELSVTDRQLAQIFTREAAVAALDRLEGAHADTGLPLDPLFALRAFPAMTEQIGRAHV